MATAGFSSPGRVSPEQQNASDAAAAAKNIRGGPMQVNNSKAEAAQAAARTKRQGYTGPNVAGVASGNTDNVEKKTDKSSTTPEDKFKKESQQVVEQSGEKNVLNKYRSVTYNFTIAALNSSHLKDPESYRNSELKLVILKSGGKGNTGLIDDTATINKDLSKGKPGENQMSRTAALSGGTNLRADLINGFNKESPGRFDMFIENVEIESIMTFNEQGNSSLPTQIKFEVVEPYSINGFIEALHVSSIAAGYPSYLMASFLLKMEFWGYPDDKDLPEPELIKDTERYYVFGLTGVDVDITEKGTRYRCTAVPYNERAFGEPNVVKKPIKMQGNTVREILNAFFFNINAQVASSDEAGKSGSLKDKHNVYEIKFPVWDDKKGFIDGPPSPIADAKFTEILKDNKLYAMVDPGAPGSPNAYKQDGAAQPTPAQQQKQPESIKYNPKDSVIQFAEGMTISDAITSVIKDSEYVRDILKNIGKRPNNPDQYGMLDYFLIKTEIQNLDIIDETSQKPFQKYIYVVTPYKIHISRIPNYGHDQIKEEELKKLSLREYNYIYTGQNVDVLNFKLNFNTLYFEAVPAAMANKDQPQTKTAAAPNNENQVKIKTPDSTLATDAQVNARANARLKRQGVPSTPVKVVPTPLQSYGGNASQPLSDPYSVLARNMHDAVINSKASMLTGEMEILGDPFYLATGGIGNYNPKPDPVKRGVTDKNEAAHNYGELLVSINFRNPIDINSFEQGGLMHFDSNRVPFSGVYRVIKVNSSFKEGSFKQKLDILRMPGQILDSNLRASDPRDNLDTSPKPGSQVVPDETRAMSPEQRMDSVTVMAQLNRGLPSQGLPGELSNFTNATGGLGGSTPSLLNQTYGLISRSGTVMPETAIAGQTLPSITDVSSNIRLKSSGLVSISQDSLQSAAQVDSASSMLTNGLPTDAVTKSLSNTLVGSSLNSSLNIPNIGSGIGKGAAFNITPIQTFPNGLTSLDVKQGLNISPTSLPNSSISNISGISKDLGAGAISAVQGIGKGAGNLINGIGDKITALRSSPMDPQGIAAKVGLDPSRLSGLMGAGLQSKLQGQISNIVKNTPADVNLTQAASAGLVLDYIPADKMKNIPATPSYATAPIPKADLGYAKEVVARGGVAALENLYGVNSPSKLSTNLVPQELITQANSVPLGAASNRLSNLTGAYNQIDINSMKDKLASAKSMISGYTKLPSIPDAGMLGSVAAKFGSSTSGQSPLDKLVSKANPSSNQTPSDLNDFYG